MDEDEQSTISTSLADAAFLLAARDVIERARRTKTPIIIWEDGQIKEMSPDEMERRLNMAKPAT
jgi:hypothetical protein